MNVIIFGRYGEGCYESLKVVIFEDRRRWCNFIVGIWCEIWYWVIWIVRFRGIDCGIIEKFEIGGWKCRVLWFGEVVIIVIIFIEFSDGKDGCGCIVRSFLFLE